MKQAKKILTEKMRFCMADEMIFPKINYIVKIADTDKSVKNLDLKLQPLSSNYARITEKC
jgi:hypothetical protein